jgi:hypothetical protein
MEERNQLISQLQQLSKHHGVRVSLYGGDLHCAAVGRLVSSTQPNVMDYRYMVQITSSGMVNIPQDNTNIQIMNLTSKYTYALDNDTQEEMVPLFAVDGQTDKKHVMGRRNYCLVEPTLDGGLKNIFVIEGLTLNGPTSEYPYYIPPLK